MTPVPAPWPETTSPDHQVSTGEGGQHHVPDIVVAAHRTDAQPAGGTVPPSFSGPVELSHRPANGQHRRCTFDHDEARHLSTLHHNTVGAPGDAARFSRPHVAGSCVGGLQGRHRYGLGSGHSSQFGRRGLDQGDHRAPADPRAPDSPMNERGLRVRFIPWSEPATSTQQDRLRKCSLTFVEPANTDSNTQPSGRCDSPAAARKPKGNGVMRLGLTGSLLRNC